MSSACVVGKIDVLNLSQDARIVAIRWDLIDWGLVLDLDVPASESEGSPMRRAWLVFSGVSEVSIPMENARLPNGVWLTSSLSVERDQAGFKVYSCNALLPSFEGNERRANDAKNTISIRAQDLTGVISTGSDNPSEPSLSYEARTRLANDQSMLEAVATLPSENS
jgi:hypothetical protein